MYPNERMFIESTVMSNWRMVSAIRLRGTLGIPDPSSVYATDSSGEGSISTNIETTSPSLDTVVPILSVDIVYLSSRVVVFLYLLSCLCPDSVSPWLRGMTAYRRYPTHMIPTAIPAIGWILKARRVKKIDTNMVNAM